MKKTGLYIIIAVLIVSISSFDVNALEPNDTVLRYFNALKNGDIETIKDSITGELYKKRKVILEQNKSYSEFLQKIYQGAEFYIKETTIENNDVLVKVEVKFLSGESNFTLYLNENAEGNWKIYKESSVP